LGGVCECEGVRVMKDPRLCKLAGCPRSPKCTHVGTVLLLRAIRAVDAHPLVITPTLWSMV